MRASERRAYEAAFVPESLIVLAVTSLLTLFKIPKEWDLNYLRRCQILYVCIRRCVCKYEKTYIMLPHKSALKCSERVVALCFILIAVMIAIFE